MSATKVDDLLKKGLIAAIAVIIIRIVLEQMGVQSSVATVFSVAWFYFVMPVFFASALVAAGDAAIYKNLAITIVKFTLVTRVVVALTYIAAYNFQWTAPRFSVQRGGSVGEGVTALQGNVITPLLGIVAWLVIALVIGMIIGSVTILIKRRMAAAN